MANGTHFAVFTVDKQTGNGGGLSAHIERRIWDAEKKKYVIYSPTSATRPERTHLNKDYLLPGGAQTRTKAIEDRIKAAGVTRKLKADAVKAITIICTSDHEKMDEIEKAGRIDEWAWKCIRYCQAEFGSDNVVSAALHMDETTPHLHITVVPIVTSKPKARKGKEAPKDNRRKYKKQDVKARLCAKEIVTRSNLTRWQTEFAGVMSAYGMKRGIEGSSQRRVEPARYNKEVAEAAAMVAVDTKKAAENDIKKARIEFLQVNTEKENAKYELNKAKQERDDAKLEKAVLSDQVKGLEEKMKTIKTTNGEYLRCFYSSFSLPENMVVTRERHSLLLSIDGKNAGRKEMTEDQYAQCFLGKYGTLEQLGAVLFSKEIKDYQDKLTADTNEKLELNSTLPSLEELKDARRKMYSQLSLPSVDEKLEAVVGKSDKGNICVFVSVNGEWLNGKKLPANEVEDYKEGLTTANQLAAKYLSGYILSFVEKQRTTKLDSLRNEAENYKAERAKLDGKLKELNTASETNLKTYNDAKQKLEEYQNLVRRMITAFDYRVNLLPGAWYNLIQKEGLPERSELDMRESFTYCSRNRDGKPFVVVHTIPDHSTYIWIRNDDYERLRNGETTIMEFINRKYAPESIRNTNELSQELGIRQGRGRGI